MSYERETTANIIDGIDEAKNIIELENINYENIVALFVAENGAMGSPGSVTILNKDLKKYHFYLNDIDFNKIRKKITKLDNGKAQSVLSFVFMMKNARKLSWAIL